MNKFRNERYIQQIQSDITGKWTFRVRIGSITKTFAEKDYGDASSAFQYAKRYRDKMLLEGMEQTININKTVSEVFKESYGLFPVRLETKRKLDGFFSKYVMCKDKDIKKIKAEDILLDLNSMIEIATDDTIQRVFAIWKKIIKTAIYKEYITKDHTMLIKCPKSHKTACFTVNKITDRQSIIEMEKLCKKHMRQPHDKNMIPLLIEFLYLTGCRICEALAITRKDITDVISIDKEIGSSMTENMVVRNCKTDLSVRRIPITIQIRAILDQAMSLHDHEVIFSDQEGNYYNSTIIGDRIHRIGKDHGYDFNLYSIRHLFATDMTIAGVDDRTKMELMGHSNIGTTLGYARSNDNLKIKALSDRN